MFFVVEFIGVFAVLFIASGMRGVYEAADGNVLGVLFGSANGSAWERSKLVSLAYIAFGALELILLKPPVTKFVFAKAVGVYALTATLPALYLLSGVSGFCRWLELIAAVVGFSVSAVVAVRVKNTDSLLLPSALALLFMVIILFCLTVAPLHNAVFADPLTGLYGVIPTRVVGA